MQTRAYERTDEGRREAIRWATTDSTIALMLALFVNAAILIVAAAAFHGTGHPDVAEIERRLRAARRRCSASASPRTLFAVALLASGLNSTVTGDAGRPDRDGGFPASAAAALGAAAAHPRHRHRAGRDRHRALRRARHQRAAGASAR